MEFQIVDWPRPPHLARMAGGDYQIFQFGPGASCKLKSKISNIPLCPLCPLWFNFRLAVWDL